LILLRLLENAFGLPTNKAKIEMVKHYKSYYGANGDLSEHDMKQWSGAEVKSCCRIAAATGTDLQSSKAFVKPIGRIAKDSLNYLEEAVKEDRFNLAEEVLKDIHFEDRELEI